MNNGIYKIKNIVNNHCYVGSCSAKTGIEYRWCRHKHALNRNTHHSIILQRAWNKHGPNNFKFSIIEECSPEQCITREQYYLDLLHPKYNICKIANSCYGIKRSPEFCKRMSEIMTGRKMSLHLKEKLRIIHSHPRTSEIKKKISDALRGKPLSLERKVKRKEWARVNNSGNKNYFYSCRGKLNHNFKGYFRFKNKSTGEEIVNSAPEFRDKFHFNHQSVNHLCAGRQRSYKNWICLGKENKL